MFFWKCETILSFNIFSDKFHAGNKKHYNRSKPLPIPKNLEQQIPKTIISDIFKIDDLTHNIFSYLDDKPIIVKYVKYEDYIFDKLELDKFKK